MIATINDATADPAIRVVRTGFLLRVFYAVAMLALLSFAISLAGRWFGHSISMGGHTDDTTVREIVIGNNVLAAPSNMIRFERQRESGIASRLDLYLRWPGMEGYSDAAGDDFNNANGARRIIFLSFESRMMSRDMSGRLEPIYRSLIVEPGTTDARGFATYAFDAKSGYMNEELVVAQRDGDTPLVARCLAGRLAEESLAPCERDIHVGDELSLVYRFPREMLADWKALDAAVLKTASAILRTGG